MNSINFDRRPPQNLQPTNLAQFGQQLRAAHAEQLARQGVYLSCDVDAKLTFDLPQPLVQQILHTWIDEALVHMPEGGQLDITFVLSSRGLEIEVADSRETDLHETQDYWHRNVQISQGTVVEWVAGTAVRIEAARCPQGGVARTVTVAHHESAGTESPAGAWRKVA